MAKATPKKKASLTLPTAFVAPVELLRAGETEPEVVNLHFKYIAPDALKTRLEELGEMTQPASILSMADGWDLDEPFNEENVLKLCNAYYGAGGAALDGLLRGLRPAREGN